MIIALFVGKVQRLDEGKYEKCSLCVVRSNSLCTCCGTMKTIEMIGRLRTLMMMVDCRQCVLFNLFCSVSCSRRMYYNNLYSCADR